MVDDPDAHRALATMRSRYSLADASLNPAVYWRITDNWLELSLRFLVAHRGVREVKDRISRDILTELDAAGIGIASATYDRRATTGPAGHPTIRRAAGTAGHGDSCPPQREQSRDVHFPAMNTLYPQNRSCGSKEQHRPGSHPHPRHPGPGATTTYCIQTALPTVLRAAFFDLDCAEVNSSATIYRGAGRDVL